MLLQETKLHPPVLSSHDEFRPLPLRAAFWRPAYLETPTYAEHLPFALWLIEAQRPQLVVQVGDSSGAFYFGFCQAVDRLAFPTQCYAVNNWKANTCPSSESYKRIKSYNAVQYGGFSRLLNEEPSAALDKFGDGTIDLLYVGPGSTKRSMVASLAGWLPKLSERAVIVFPGAGRRALGCGEESLLDELAATYPAFSFLHEGGLDVIGFGKQQNDMMGRLFQSGPGETRAIQQVFTRLGRACSDAYRATEKEDRADQLADELAALRDTVEAMRSEHSAAVLALQLDAEMAAEAIAKADAKTRQLSEALSVGTSKNSSYLLEIANLTQLLHSETKQHAATVKELAAEKSSLRKTCDELIAETTRSNKELAKFTQLHLQHLGVESALRMQVNERGEELAKLAQLLVERKKMKASEQSQGRDGSREAPGTPVQVDRAAGVRRKTVVGARGKRQPGAIDENRLATSVSAIRGSAFFDEAWYLETNADVAASGLDAALHYLVFGAAEGRNPGPRFSTSDYLRENPELARSDMNPLLHFHATHEEHNNETGLAIHVNVLN